MYCQIIFASTCLIVPILTSVILVVFLLLLIKVIKLVQPVGSWLTMLTGAGRAGMTMIMIKNAFSRYVEAMSGRAEHSLSCHSDETETQNVEASGQEIFSGLQAIASCP